ncbi:MAG TPA: long-chain-fatty-acid--CoA ligase [Candidatus Dormibacteraeota bacterium]
MRTISQGLRWRARRHPDLEALWYRGQSTTYGQLDQQASALAAGLIRELDLTPGDRVAVLDKNTAHALELMLALDRAGVVAVPVNWRLTASEVATVVNDAEPVALVVDEEFRQSADQVACRVMGFDELPRDADAGDPRRDAENSVTWQLYTSGTTGLPKGAMLTNLNLNTLTGSLLFEIPELREGGRSLVAMPLYHIGGCGWALASILCGSTAVIVREFLPQEVLKILAEQRVDTAFLVPAALLFLTSMPEAQTTDFSNLKNVAYGASPISPEILKRSIDTFKCRFTQLYGLTETTGAAVALTFENHEGERLLSAGRPMYGVDVRVVDPDDKEVPAGEIGEIVIRAPTVMQGYWRRDEDTKATIRDGWFHSGDAGTMDADGFVYIKDRIKDMIVSGGENVYPAEIEAVLAGHPDVADVAVIGVPDDQWGETVKALVVAKDGATPDGDAIIDWARERLAGFKRPRSVDFVETIPRNPSGKILKRELREPYWAGKTRRVS